MKEEDLFEYAADILWPLFDANNDGKIDFNEFSIGTFTFKTTLLIDDTLNLAEGDTVNSSYTVADC